MAGMNRLFREAWTSPRRCPGFSKKRANLNQEVRDLEEEVVLFQNQFLTCIVILTGDGKGMQAMGGAGSKCWLCKDPNGIVEQMRGGGVHLKMGGIF